MTAAVSATAPPAKLVAEREARTGALYDRRLAPGAESCAMGGHECRR
jgi:hypothetical protein